MPAVHCVFWGTGSLDDDLRTASIVSSEPVQCLALTRWDFLSALREGDVEMSILILQELANASAAHWILCNNLSHP